MNFDKTIEQYSNKINYFNYSERTNEIYSHYVLKFLQKVNKYPQHLTSYDFENYLFNYNFSSISQQNQIINALKFFNNNTYSKCIIYSDSQYVINTINNNWKRNKNNDLWEQLDSLISSNIKFVWVKGHDGNEMNEKADKLAVCGSELFIP